MYAYAQDSNLKRNFLTDIYLQVRIHTQTDILIGKLSKWRTVNIPNRKDKCFTYVFFFHCRKDLVFIQSVKK